MARVPVTVIQKRPSAAAEADAEYPDELSEIGTQVPAVDSAMTNENPTSATS
jgi:hypothetical protein